VEVRALLTPACLARLSRRRALSCWLALSVAVPLFTASYSQAQSGSVPVELQAELLSKLAAYDRNFRARAEPRAKVLIIFKPGSPKSNLSAAAMKLALSRTERIGGLPHEEQLVAFHDAPGVAHLCRAQKAAILYVTAGFDPEINALRAALTGVDVLSVSADPVDVPHGIVLGFELVSGKPKIVLNLQQARQQNVNFSADVLRLMRVYR
jgi:hypothetical protein